MLSDRRPARALPSARAVLQLLLAALLAACGGDSPTGSEPGARVELARDTATILVGQTLAIGATVRDRSGAPLSDSGVVWRSSAPAVATVAGGVVAAVSPGTALVSAHLGRQADTVRVTVEPFVPTRLTVSPDSLVLESGASASVSAVAYDAIGRTAPTNVVWTSSDTTVAVVLSSIVVARGGGEATLTASAGSARATVRVRVRAVQEARALWVSRFEYNSAASIETIMQRAADANFNIVYFQVRGMADALYASQIEPCGISLCGSLGGTPPYDPLAVAVSAAHRRGLQLHAWLNALTGWAAGSTTSCSLLRESTPRHALLEHPEWAMVSSSGAVQPCPNSAEYVYLNPAVAGVRTRLGAVAADIVRRYAVDGIHLDRIRYPGTDFSYDTASIRAFGRDPRDPANAAAWSQFRRDQVSLAVRETFDSIRAVRPRVVLSAAVWGIYRDRWGWNSSNGYSQYLQDPRAWAAGDYLDVAVPMTYYKIAATSCGYADWTCVVDDHLQGIEAATGTPVYAGILASHGEQEVLRQISVGRARGARGFAIYSYSSIPASLWSSLRSGPFASPAEVPPVR